MANSIWDVVYGEDRFKGLLGQEGVHATGGGTVYDPTADYKETRYDNQGNSYLSNPDAPLIPGHTRAGDTPMFESTKVELPPVQSPHDYGSNYYSGKPWTPEVTRPNVQSATIDSLLAQQGVNQVTQQEQDQFNRINASQNRETRYDDQGNPYQVRRDLPLIPGHTRSLEPQSVEPKVDPMSLYNRQGRADYTPQNIVSDDVVMGKPPLGYYPNASERAEAEERWYQNQDKIEAQIQELLKGTALEQQSLEAEDDKLLQQFQQDDFNQRVQDRLSQPTPDWLGQSQGALTDAQREDLNRYTDTDSFGNPLDTDAFGNTNYETNLNRQLDKLNRPFYDEFYGADAQEQAPTPQQASNTTDFFRDRAQASKKYQDAILNIGDTIGEGVSSLYEGAKDLGSNIDLSGVGESISNIWGDLTKKDDRSFVERMSDTEQNIAQPLREGITDTASTIWEGGKQGADMFIESAKAFGGDVKGVYDTINRLGNDFYTKYIDSPKDAREKGADLGNTLKVASENMNESVAEQLQMLSQIVDEPVEFFQQVANLGEGAIAEYGDDGLLGVGTSKSAIGLGLNRVLENKFPELAEFNKKTRAFLGFESQENQREMAKAMWEQIKQDYGSWEGYKQHVSQNPSQALLELTGLGFMARAGGRAVKSKLNDPEFLDKIDELSRQLPETQMSAGMGRSEMVGGDYKGSHTAPEPEGKTVYHGTNKVFDELDPNMAGTNFGFDEQGAVFFTTDKDRAPRFSKDYPKKPKYMYTDEDKVAVKRAEKLVKEAKLDDSNALTISEVVELYEQGKIKTKPTTKDLFRAESAWDNNRKSIKEASDVTGKKVFKHTAEGETQYAVFDTGRISYNNSNKAHKGSSNKADDGVLGQVGKTTKDTVDALEQQAKKYKTSEDWLRAGGADIDLLDEMAFGFSEKSLKTLSPKDLNIKWQDDMLNVEQAIRKSGKTETEWAKSVNLEEPIDVVFENGKFYVDDGHHRYKASKILNKDLNINLEIKDKPIAKITGTKNYNYDDFVRGLWNKFNSKADDGVLGQIDKEPLVAHHNMVSEALEKHSEHGGDMAMPSFGISKPDAPFGLKKETTFGEIALLGDKDLIDPKKYDTYSSDAYTGRSPREMVVIDKDVEKVKNALGADTLKFHNRAFYDKGLHDPDGLAQDLKLQELLEEKGYKSEDYRSFASMKRQATLDLGNKEVSYMSIEASRNPVELGEMKRLMLLESGGKKEFTPKRALAEMRKQGGHKKGSERELSETDFLHASKARALTSKKYQNLDELMRERNRVQERGQFEHLEREFDGLFTKTVNDVEKVFEDIHGKRRKSYKDGDKESSKNLNREESLTAIEHTLLGEKIPSWLNLSTSDIVKIQQAVKPLQKMGKDMPTGYFESKPNRIINIGEFKTAIVPKDDKKSIKRLEKLGIKNIVTYDKDNINTYIDAFKKNPELFFSKAIIPTGGLLGMGESEETQADETEGLLKLNKTADKPMKGVLDGVADSKVQRGKNWDNLSSKIRNYVNVKTNNPGNLTFSKNPIDWDGGVDEHYETDKDKYYQFTTPEYGIRALTRDITNKRDKKGLDTIAKIIPVYSPKKSGNDPENYIRIVSQRTGIDRDAKLTDDDMMKIVKGITHMEGAGSLAYYTDDIVIKGIKMAYRNRYQNIND